ncbi:hypothetical protein [Flavobacterium sp.]|uniref:hypothetical protein n=1 Tax=Flavobacterium sp. TaxID=239 RepID=UPI00404756D7
MKFKLFILSLTIIFISCKKDDLLKAKENIEFNNSLKGNYRYFGTFKEKENTIIFFGDLMTAKKIYFHNEKGHLIDSISFNNKQLEDYDFDLNFISKDTFLLTNKKYIFALNKKCEIIKTIDIDSFLKNEPNDYHFKIPYDIHGKELKNNILISLDWRKNKNEHQPSSIEEFIRSSFMSPNLGLIQNVFSDVPNYKLHTKNYYQYFFENYGSFTERFYAYSFNDEYVIPPNYSDNFIVFKKDLKSHKIIKLQSKYCTNNRIKPLISETKNFKYARIQNIFYSEKVEKYFVILRHELKENDEKYRLSRPFSIIVLNREFEKIDEKAILDDSFTNHLSFNINDKIYIKQNLKNESKNIFSVF